MACLKNYNPWSDRTNYYYYYYYYF